MRVEIEGYIRLEENEEEDNNDKTLIDFKMEWSGKISPPGQFKLLKEINKQIENEIEVAKVYGQMATELDIRKKV